MFKRKKAPEVTITHSPHPPDSNADWLKDALFANARQKQQSRLEAQLHRALGSPAAPFTIETNASLGKSNCLLQVLLISIFLLNPIL